MRRSPGTTSRNEAPHITESMRYGTIRTGATLDARIILLTPITLILTSTSHRPGGANNPWMQIGYEKDRFWATSCATDFFYYWEENDANGGYTLGLISSPSPLGSREWTLERSHSGCAAGVNWCWRFEIDGALKHTCCGDETGFENSGLLTVATECGDDNFNADCPASGLNQSLGAFEYKDTSGYWFNWSGQDNACVDFDRSARGKWTSANSADAGYNVSLSGSLTNGCH
jgi:hypothetical protein